MLIMTEEELSKVVETPRTTGGRGRKREKPPTESAGGTPVGPGANGTSTRDNPEVRGAVLSAIEQIAELETQRSDINAQIKALREGLVARGINLHALKHAERYHKMTEDQRTGYDDSLVICRKAMQVPIQTALALAPAAEPGDDEAGTTRH